VKLYEKWIGPSGSGKSTLLRCLNRLEQPSAGSIVVAGIDMLSPKTDINHARQHIGMVFQSFNLYPHMTALGCSRRLRQRSRVDLPEPDGPITNTSSRSVTSRSTPLRTWR
jgi:ABC-type phosphate transport system ATPase subunit